VEEQEDGGKESEEEWPPNIKHIPDIVIDGCDVKGVVILEYQGVEEHFHRTCLLICMKGI
jgi:hypothetical protein